MSDMNLLYFFQADLRDYVKKQFHETKLQQNLCDILVNGVQDTSFIEFQTQISVQSGLNFR